MKKNALPTLNLPPDINLDKSAIVTMINENYDEILKNKLISYVEENKKEEMVNQIEDINREHDYIKPTKKQKVTNEDKIETKCNIYQPIKSLSPSSYTSQYYEKATFEYEKTLKTNEHLLIKYDYLKSQFDKLNKRTTENNKRIEELKKVLREKQDKQLNHGKVQQILEKCFTKNQVKLILKRNRRAPWTTEEILQALTIRHFSKRCYIYLQKKLHFPLPGLSTIQRWLSNITVNQGLLPDVFRFMDIASNNFEDYERVVILQFDKMKVRIISSERKKIKS